MPCRAYYENSSKIDVKLNHTFPNGTNSMLMWRASDIAGNGPIESEPYVINVNTWVPQIKPKVTSFLTWQRDNNWLSTKVSLKVGTCTIFLHFVSKKLKNT